MQDKRYLNKRGQLVYVDYWGSHLWTIRTNCRRGFNKHNGTFPSEESAQDELDRRARKRGWEEVKEDDHALGSGIIGERG